ncbi:MAG: phosphomannose isomerase type II C-terminal cupin domain [Akkermansia sp.]
MKTYTTGEVGQRPWGCWQVLDAMDKAIVKKIQVNPGHRLSLQKHNHRAETWSIAAGVATVECDGVISVLQTGDSIHLPLGSIHRVTNNHDEALVFIEIQMGDILAESDIERFEDDYKRV